MPSFRNTANQVYPVGIGYGAENSVVLCKNDMYALKGLPIFQGGYEPAHGGILLRLGTLRHEQ